METATPATPTSQTSSSQNDNIPVHHRLAVSFMELIQHTKKEHPDLDFFEVLQALAISGTNLLYEQAVVANPAILTDEQFRSVADHVGKKLSQTFKELDMNPAMEMIGLTAFLGAMGRFHSEQMKQYAEQFEKQLAEQS